MYKRQPNDLQWGGDLGEIVFNKWLIRESIEFDWIVEDTGGQPDFIVPGMRLDIKTRKIDRPIKQWYAGTATENKNTDFYDHLFFCAYNWKTQVMWLMGYIPKEEFIKKSKFYTSGQKADGIFEVPEGQEVRTIEYKKLYSCREFLEKVRK